MRNRNVVSGVVVLSLLSASARADSFFDDFNRPNSATVGNGWSDLSGNLNGNLIILDNELRVPSAAGYAGIARPFDLGGPVQISVNFKESSGFGGLLRRYNHAVAVRNDQSLGTGYGIRLGRSDANFNNSQVQLFDGNLDNSTPLAILPANFQFGASLRLEATFQTDGRVTGSVFDTNNRFDFNFGPRSVQSAGSNVAVGLEFPNPGASVFARADDFFVSDVPKQKVHLAWGQDLPLRITRTFVNNDANYAHETGSMAAAAIGVADRIAWESTLRTMFAGSGVSNIEFVSTPSPDAETVYFAQRPLTPGWDLGGQAITGVDAENRNRAGQAVVFVPAGPLTTFGRDSLAISTAHEVGHLFGLRHVNPDAALSPAQRREIMDYDRNEIPANERFINAVSTEFDFEDGVEHTHNPRYHLERYVDGRSHDELVGEGVHPGSWDRFLTRGLATFDFLDNIRGDTQLFDVTLYAGVGDEDSVGRVAFFASATLQDLEALQIELPLGGLLRLSGKTSPDGELNVMLGGLDLTAGNFLILQPGQLTGSLYTYDAAGTTTPFIAIQVTTTVVPEPAGAMLLLIATQLLRRR